MVEFHIDHKVTGKHGLNKIYAGIHWAVRKQDADYFHQLVYAEMRRQKVPKKLFDKPVIVEISYQSKLDIDNHGYLSKLIIDGMKDYLLVDDTKKYVVGLIQRYKSKGEGITVRVGEVDEQERA